MSSRRLFPFALVAVLLLYAAALTAAPEKRVALVIGNGKYSSAPLANPVNDATDVAALLKKLGFEVILKRDAGKKAMDQAVKEFYRKLQEGKGVGLFYYAGHGIQVRGQNYLVPVDAEIESEGDVDYSAIEAGWVLRKMEDAGNPVNIVVLDACRNNPFTRGFRSAERGLAQMPSPTGSIIAYATGPGDVAADGEGRNGLYTKHLLRHLTAPGLSVEEVFSQVRQGVWTESGKKQTPWTSSSLMGKVSLARDVLTITTAPSQPAADDPLKDERERLEQEKLALEALKAQVEMRKELEEERKLLEQERLVLLDRAKAPSPAEAVSVRKVRNSLGMEFVWIAPGSFEMGSPPGEPGRNSDENQHRVTLSRGYYLQTTEVTQGQWRAIMELNYSRFQECGNDCPVENLAYPFINEFIEKLNARGEGTYRLPTEAEWEYACRAGSKGRYSFGEDESRLEEYAWYDGNSGGRIHPVASKKANQWGLYDMHGNVWEMCSDWKGNYPSGAVTDPVGPKFEWGAKSVARGGSWHDRSVFVRSAYRFMDDPGERYGLIGFRLVRNE